jgi:hypothetical protein
MRKRITTISDFEDEDPNYDNRQRLQVTLLMRNHFKGKRVFLDHFLRWTIRKELTIYTSAINLITKINFWIQSSNGALNSRVQRVIRFGDSYVASGINDQTHYNKMYNKLDWPMKIQLLGSSSFLQMILEVIITTTK